MMKDKETMTHFDTIQRLIVESLLIPAESIRPEDEIAQLKNIDSLTFEMILVSIESETGRTIDPMDLMHVKTVGDLAKLLD